MTWMTVVHFSSLFKNSVHNEKFRLQGIEQLILNKMKPQKIRES